MKKFLFVITLAVLGLMIGTGSAMAVSYPSLPPASYPVAGESLLKDGFDTYIDWIVHYIPSAKNPADYTTFENDIVTNIGSIAVGNYTYLYQLEHPTTGGSAVDVDEFFIPGIRAGTVLGHGWGDDRDLDDDHNSTNFANLAGEHEEGSVLENVYNSQINALDTMIWDFENNATSDDGVPKGAETELMWLVSTMNPIYMTGQADFSGNPKSPSSGDVPGPAPEPASMALMGIGLLGAIGTKFGRRKK